MLQYKYIHTIDAYVSGVEELTQYPRLALDAETYVLKKWKQLGLGKAVDAHTARISLLTLMGQGNIPFIFDLIRLEQAGYDAELIKKLLLNRKYLIAHNAKFDARFIKAHLGIDLWNFHCTLQLAKLHANATGSKFARQRGLGLADLLRDFFNIKMTGKGKEQITDWETRPRDNAQPGDQDYEYWLSKLEYAANDVPMLFELHDLLWNLLTLPLPKTTILTGGTDAPLTGLGMKGVVKQEMTLIRTITEMEFNGFPISMPILTGIQKAIFDPDLLEGRLLEVASEIAKELGLETLPSPFHDYEIPSEATLKTLNNPVKLKGLIRDQLGLQKLDNAQSSVIQRLIDLMEQMSSDEGEVEWADEEEEMRYQDLKLIEKSVVVENCKLAKLILEYKKLFKQSGMDLRKYVNPQTNCIHSSYDANGAATGRSSSASPNGQNISGRTKVPVLRPLNNLFPPSTTY